MRLEQKAAQILIKKKKTLAVAESCTGGLLAHRLTNIPGSSDFFKLGLVVYSNEAKIKLLRVPRRTLSAHGAVSEAVALHMAKAVRRIQKTDFGISITGIAGPAGATAKKPVGLTYIAISTPSETCCLCCLFRGDRTRIKSAAAAEALRLLRKFLE